MDANGANPRRIVTAPGFDGVTVPSPDGRWIAFQRGVQQGDAYQWDLFLVDSEGKQERRLTQNRWSSQVPTWSPDGKRLVIYADPNGRDQLFSFDIASGKTTPLAPSDAADNAPALSHDGNFVAFTSTRTGSRDLHRLDLRTGAVIPLTKGFDVWSQPSWSPDGRHILFSAQAQGVHDIYVISADGSGLRKLTRGSDAWFGD
jgi:TolB protein